MVELEEKLEQLRSMTSKETDFSEEIKKLTKKIETTRKKIFNDLTPWERVQVARHPSRPYTKDYIDLIMTDFIEIHGDRYFSDDKAIIGGFARLEGEKVVVLGHQKGRDIKENLLRNFGSAHPEGYRKAIRIMKMAEKFSLPIIAFIDTPGAYPGVGAEERGQAEAIAVNLREMAHLTVPVIVVVIGEGGSGGALGIGIGNKIAILENAYYSVISPEGCAAILWKDNTKAADAAKSLRLTAQDLLEMKIVDDVIKEPLGGAHRDIEKTTKNMKARLMKYLEDLKPLSKKELVEQRYTKFRAMGVFAE
ncbi:MAG: acetyl-CoA carboxylase carboxyltransferase subunit alpha [Candidatus Omnitrophica bacterium]|nr:acetyl-CoA carboxylase carboxyltransferase subunit alpha [Candidatus Omnitrophota bacterium]